METTQRDRFQNKSYKVAGKDLIDFVVFSLINRKNKIFDKIFKSFV